MIHPIARYSLACYLLFLSAPVLAETVLSTEHSHEANEVSVDIPDEAPAVQLAPLRPAATLLGRKNNGENGISPPDTPADSPSESEKSASVSEQNSLENALAYVYEHHPQLLAEREKLKAVDESVAQAVSDFRPSIGAEFSKGRTRKSSDGDPWEYGDSKNKGLSVTQPIFSGLDGVAGLKAAKQQVKAARAELTALEQQLFFNAIVAYTGVAEAQAVLALNQQNVDLLTKQRDAAQARFDVGELTKTDVSQAEARLASAKAAEQQAIGDLAIAEAGFVRAVGIAAAEKPAMPPLPAALPESLEEASTQARAASPILEAAKHREKAFESAVDSRIGQILPDVSLQGTLARTEGGSSFVDKYDSDALMLNVSIPLYQSGAEWSRLREARNVAAQARFNTLDTSLAVEQDVSSAWQNYVTAQSVIRATEAASNASHLALEGVRQENEFGTRTVLDVLDAEQENMNIKVNLVRAHRNHVLQAYRLLASVGKLTAQTLILPTKIYDPTEHYHDVKYQLLGW